MKTTISILTLAAALTLSSCSGYTGMGAMTGAQFGHIIGSSIGGITGGGRGHDLGALVGLAGGAVAGAAIGSAVDHAQNAPQREYEQAQARQRSQDDVVDYGGGNGYAAQENILLRHLTLNEQQPDQRLVRGEEATITFDMVNGSSNAVYNVTPVVEEVTGNKHIHVSPNLVVRQIAPYQGVRYTATIKADKGLKVGVVTLRVSAKDSNGRTIAAPQQVSIRTYKK